MRTFDIASTFSKVNRKKRDFVLGRLNSSICCNSRRFCALIGGFEEYHKAYAFYCDNMSVEQTHSVDPSTYIPYPNAIVPNLIYLGGLQEATCLENLQDVRVTHVV